MFETTCMTDHPFIQQNSVLASVFVDQIASLEWPCSFKYYYPVSNIRFGFLFWYLVNFPIRNKPQYIALLTQTVLLISLWPFHLSTYLRLKAQNTSYTVLFNVLYAQVFDTVKNSSSFRTWYYSTLLILEGCASAHIQLENHHFTRFP